MHWVGVAVRESVINAIRHGNASDAGSTSSWSSPSGSRRAPTSWCCGPRPGRGVRAGGVADPLAPENMLKSSGRGIFLMRSFMDDVPLRRAPEGGMEVRMVKKLPAASRRCPAASTSVHLDLHAEPRPSRHRHRGRVRAGEMQMARFGADSASTRRAHRSRDGGRPGRRAHVPRADRRAVSRSRRARRRVRRQRDRASRRGTCWVFDPDRRHDQLRARPADLLLRRWRSRSTARPMVAAVYDPTGEELFTAERGTAPG